MLGPDGSGGTVPMDAYDYGLPDDAVAQHPAEPRSASRLLVAPGLLGPGVVHSSMESVPSLIRPGDVLVVNDTKVLTGRLMLNKATGGSVEVLLLEPERRGDGWWQALVRPGRRARSGTELFSNQGPDGDRDAGASRQPVAIVGEPVSGLDDARRSVRILDDGLIDRCGTMPLPPYITEALADQERYQTVYAGFRTMEERSSAAPTAGLHFTKELLDGCRRSGATVVSVDLAIGLDTFRPVTADRPEDHEIHTERYRVPDETVAACRDAERVIAVGTTAVRALESLATTGEQEGRTSLFIRGDFPFRMVDVLLTNFHLPRSSLLLLVESFAGPSWRELYAEALADGYRFLSFGDAMVVARSRSRAPSPFRRSESGDERERAHEGEVAPAAGRVPPKSPKGVR